MKRALLFSLAAAAALSVAPTSDAFCGFYVGGAGAKLFNDATMVVLMREGQRTVLSMQNAYKGPPERFAMVVPVPVVLQEENVKTLPAAIFDKVDQLASPRLVEYWEQDPCAQGSLPKGAFPAAPRAFAAVGGAAEDRGGLGVKIEAQFTVGEYQIVILSAEDASGLDTWLRRENYTIPEGAEPYFRPYVAAGSKFFVARVDTSKVKMQDGVAVLSPLRFHYDSDEFKLPVRLGLINSSGTQDLIVHVLARGQRFEVANYANVTIPTNFDVAESAADKFGTFYAALFDRTLEKNPKAVVTEYSWDASSCDPCPGPTLDWSDLATLGADVLPSSQAAPEPSPFPTPVPLVAAPDAGGAKDAGSAVAKDAGAALVKDAGSSAASKVAVPPVTRPPTPRFNPWAGGGFTITRLHARYTKDALGEDLVFRAAPAIMGGREVRSPDGKLEHGAVPGAGMNNFQARYAIRHPWTGPIECKEPVRGVWGGKPGKNEWDPNPPKAARKLGFVSRAPVDLASIVKSDVPEIGISHGGGAETKKGCLGCSVVPSDAGGSALGASAFFAGIAALVSRRKRR